jgi:hypothetical protein
MVHLVDLWLPIVLSAVFVFVISSVIHMLLPFHKAECRKLPGEEGILDAIRAQNVPLGEYRFPAGNSMKEMCSPEMTQKFQRGPVGLITVLPNGPISLGRSLGLWFLLCILIGVFTGYIASIGLARGASGMNVFRLASAAGILGYAVTSIQNSIWKGVSCKTTAKYFVDGLAYGIATGATFAWLWPGV